MQNIYELLGLIEDINFDDVANEEKIHELCRWVKENGDIIRRREHGEEILDKVKSILKDGTVTEKEQGHLLSLLKNIIQGAQLKVKIEYLRDKVKHHQNIGLDLIDILDNENAINVIHHEAKQQLNLALQSYTGFLMNPEIVFISLCLIGMLQYNGNFYENVRITYKSLYVRYSEQKIEGTIRSILSEYRTKKENRQGKSRIINVVLSNAIVPVYYLPAFFDFIYDIYKLNFEYDLPENLSKEFRFVYEGLRDVMLSEGDDIKVNVTKKSYKLIKTTKQLIINENYSDVVIGLSIIIVKLIDKRVWNKKIKIFNPYLKIGFESWEKTFRDASEGKSHRIVSSEFRSRWEPKFKLYQNKLYLVPPIHRVKSQYNYYDIKIILKNGKHVLYTNDQPCIKEIIGGYQVSLNKINLLDPLGKLQYLLIAGDEIIYDSRRKLYRDYLVFDNAGNEISNNTDYKGTAILCTSGADNRGTVFFKSNTFILSSLTVDYDDTLFLSGDIFSFSSLMRPGIFGNELQHQYLKKPENDELIPVFLEVKFLVFESVNDTEKYEFDINSYLYKLSDFNYTKSERHAAWKYVVDLNIDNPGIYFISVYEWYKGKRTKIATFQFGYDPSYNSKVSKIDDFNYELIINSSLRSGTVHSNINIESYSEDWLRIQLNNEEYIYYLSLNLEMYRLQGNGWKSYRDNLWIGDIDQDSVLETCAFDYDRLDVCSSSGQLLQEDVPINDCKNHIEVSIGFLQSFKEANDFVILLFSKNGLIKKGIYCYNRCVIDKGTTEIYFDPVSKILSVRPQYFGKGNVIFEIMNENGKLVYSSSQIKSGACFKVRGLESFIKYQFFFYEKSKGLVIKKARELMKQTSIFYALDDFVGRYFKIKEVLYDQRVRGEFLRKMQYFNRVYIYFTDRVSNDIFKGDIIIKAGARPFRLANVNPVEIEICGNIVNNELELAITKAGDGLLLDFKHHGIMNTLDDNKAIDIYSYFIDINGRKSL
ncbi:hypothetical protein PT285_07790 [Lactobacillus sp. ESL0791]|uniref:hypothetical protein n=1 Tax=Lactobacillus sp. ESL0791 TaxID=2983234 RepID=UPI0023F871A6|nr:hypothetical protein [Lactobacillus sp. ESL0791]MDF7639301.1 hypothetical protein [Lactobacillus sp. ESL0791]